MELLLEGKLNEYLHDIDEECHEMLDRIVEKMKVKARCDRTVEGRKSDAVGREDE